VTLADAAFNELDTISQNNIINALAAEQDENWVKNLLETCQEAGYTILTDVESAINISLNTLLENAKSRLSDVSTALTSAASNRSKGQTVDEAKKEFASLGLSGTFEDWYVWDDTLGGLKIADEKWQEAMAEARDNNIARLQGYQEQVGKATEILASLPETSEKRGYSASDLGLSEEDDIWKDLQSYLANLDHSATLEDYKAYFEALGKQLGKETDWYIKQAENAHLDAEYVKMAEDAATARKQFSSPSGIGDRKWLEAHGYSGPTDEQSVDEFLRSRGYIYNRFSGEITRSIDAIQEELDKTSENTAAYRGL